MANAPLGTSVRMPSEKSRKKAITAIGVWTSGGAGQIDTLTLDSDYPPIDMGLQSPVLGIAIIEGETPASDIPFACLPTNQMGRGTAADTQGKFRILTGRTISLFHDRDLDGVAIVSYIPIGSSQNV